MLEIEQFSSGIRYHQLCLLQARLVVVHLCLNYDSQNGTIVAMICNVLRDCQCHIIQVI